MAYPTPICQLIKEHNLQQKLELSVHKRTTCSSFDASNLPTSFSPALHSRSSQAPQRPGLSDPKLGGECTSEAVAPTLNQRDCPRPVSSVRSTGHGRGYSQPLPLKLVFAGMPESMAPGGPVSLLPQLVRSLLPGLIITACIGLSMRNATMAGHSPAVSLLFRIWIWLKSEWIQGLPEEKAACEFDCRRDQCLFGEWLSSKWRCAQEARENATHPCNRYFR